MSVPVKAAFEGQEPTRWLHIVLGADVAVPGALVVAVIIMKLLIFLMRRPIRRCSNVGETKARRGALGGECDVELGRLGPCPGVLAAYVTESSIEDHLSTRSQ